MVTAAPARQPQRNLVDAQQIRQTGKKGLAYDAQLGRSRQSTTKCPLRSNKDKVPMASDTLDEAPWAACVKARKEPHHHASVYC